MRGLIGTVSVFERNLKLIASRGKKTLLAFIIFRKLRNCAHLFLDVRKSGQGHGRVLEMQEQPILKTRGRGDGPKTGGTHLVTTSAACQRSTLDALYGGVKRAMAVAIENAENAVVVRVLGKQLDSMRND